MITRALRLLKPALISSLPIVLVVVCIAPLSAQTQEGEITIRVLVFSGRPDPELSLTPDRDRDTIEAIRTILDEASQLDRSTDESLIPSILGYRGIVIRNPDRMAGLPSRMLAYNGIIEIGEAEKRFLADPDRKLERLVLQMAVERELVEPALLRSEKLQ